MTPATFAGLRNPLRGRTSGALAGRLALVLLAATLSHTLIAPQLAPPGAAPDLLLLATLAVAATVPAPRAVAFGFVAGLVADLFLVTPFGLSAAAFTAVARAGAALPPSRRAILIAPRVVAGASIAGALVMAGTAALGEGPVPSSADIAPLARASLTAGALSPPVFAAVGRLTRGGRRDRVS